MELETLHRWIEESRHMVFFGGAGVSTESGIPDFRSADGLYYQKYDYPPEEILSHSFFVHHPGEFYRFYRDKLQIAGAKPNPAHLYLAELERRGICRAVITQNIDGLHQAAGSQNVLELHGTLWKNYCIQCGKAYSMEAVVQSQDVPLCTCGGVIRPDVVLYEEMLDQNVLQKARQEIRQSDLLIVGGTSLVVYPAAGLLQDYRGHRLVLINKSPTPYDRAADLCISGKIGEIFSDLQAMEAV